MEHSAYERANPGTGSPLPPVYPPDGKDVVNGWRRNSPPAAFEPLQVLDIDDPWDRDSVDANTPG